MSKEYYKIVMLGEGRVGKTSLTCRYVQNTFDKEQVSTTNASYLEKQIELSNGQNVNIAIWDTAGQEQFSSLAPMYYRDAHGAILVYDITYKQSFDKINKWYHELQQFAKPDIEIIIVGNKSDMELQRQIDKQMAEGAAQQYNCQHILASAKSGANVQQVYETIAQKISQKKSQNNKGKKKNLLVGNSNNKKKKEKCC